MNKKLGIQFVKDGRVTGEADINFKLPSEHKALKLTVAIISGLIFVFAMYIVIFTIISAL